MADVAGVVEQRAPLLDRVEVLRERLEVSHGTPANSVSGDMSSTCCSVRTSSSRCSGRTGAIEKPQLPATTLVTPCQHDGTERRVPEHLRVVVRVDVDEARADDVAGGVEHARAVEAVADLGDHAVGDRDVGRRAGRAGAVDERAAADDDVCGHGSLLVVVGAIRAVSLARGWQP